LNENREGDDRERHANQRVMLRERRRSRQCQSKGKRTTQPSPKEDVLGDPIGGERGSAE
jgi:hypothetical protein